MNVIELKNYEGQMISCVEHDFITKSIEKNGAYEKDSLELITSILKNINKPVLLDIGANIGNHCLVLSKYTDAIYAFEPAPFTFKLLAHNISKNNIHNAKAFNIALSDENRKGVLSFNLSGNIGASSLEDFESEDTRANISVDMACGDAFLEQDNIHKIDFIKVDVEGHEIHTLKGISNTIKKIDQ